MMQKRWSKWWSNIFEWARKEGEILGTRGEIGLRSMDGLSTEGEGRHKIEDHMGGW